MNENELDKQSNREIIMIGLCVGLATAVMVGGFMAIVIILARHT